MSIETLVQQLNTDRITLPQAAALCEAGWSVPDTGEVLRVWKDPYRVGLGVYQVGADLGTGEVHEALVAVILPRQRTPSGPWDEWVLLEAT